MFERLFKKTLKKKILVISGWWARWSYALGVLKAIEELGIDKDIKAVYWVSIGAIIWAARLNWIKAEDIFQILLSLSVRDFYWRDILKKSWWFISNKKIISLFEEYLPSDFKSLRVPFYVWAVDTNNAEYKLFHEWDLRKIVLGSMSIPWVFPPIEYWDYSLVDWWVLNNFPVDIAKKRYPNYEIIWIALNKFQTNQKIRSPFDNLLITLEVMMRAKLIENTKLVDYLFYRDLPIPVL